MFRLCLAFALLFFTIPMSHAEEKQTTPLTSHKVAAFVHSLKAFENVSNEMEAQGLRSFFKPNPLHMANMGLPMYERNIEDLKRDHPDSYKKLDQAVQNHSYETQSYFTSPEDWAAFGDRVMITHFAANSDKTKTGFSRMSQRFAPAMAENLPPEARAQLQSVLDMMQSLQNVSDADAEIVRPYDTEIVKHLHRYVVGKQ